MSPKRKKRKKAKNKVQPDLNLETIEAYNQLPIDDARFVKAYLTNGGNQLQAAQIAWPHLTYGSAAHAGAVAFRRLRDIVTIHMDQRGLTLDKLITGILEGLKATQPVVVTRKTFHENGKRKDEWEEVTYADDFKTRHKYQEMALRLRGELSKQPEVVVIQPPAPANQTNMLNAVLTPQTLVQFEEVVMAEIRHQLLKNTQADQEAKIDAVI